MKGAQDFLALLKKNEKINNKQFLDNRKFAYSNLTL